MMDLIAQEVQGDPDFITQIRAGQGDPDPTESDAITLSARQTAETVPTAAIVSFTASGATILRAARERARVPVIAVTMSATVARQMSIVWGVHPVLRETFGDLSGLAGVATDIARSHGFANAGDRIVITAGAPFGAVGSTNTLRIVHA
jgi:pyruvate kinase